MNLDALGQLSQSPLFAFTVLLLVALVTPPIFEKLRLPGLVGLLVAGIVLGHNGLGVLDAESETIKLLGDIGKIYLMFVAGLEIDLTEFQRSKNRSIFFGVATFTLPMLVGSTIGLSFGMNLNAAILVGSLLASHTLLAYPIVNRLGVAKREAIAVTIGATIITDISALLVLAICVSIYQGEFSAASLAGQLIALVIYATIILFGFDWAGRTYFQRSGTEESSQFLFILLAVFVAAAGAQLINIEAIVGAFLAGLAVNNVLNHSPVEEKVVFVGSTLFIPFFFINMGLLIDLSGMEQALTSELWLTLAIVFGLIGSKFGAAWATKLRYHYSWTETLAMWSLSLPQVAATLAATLVGVQAGVLPKVMFNVIIILMLVTSVCGPILTDIAARKLRSTDPTQELENWSGDSFLAAIAEPSDDMPQHDFKVLLPLANPNTRKYLVEMGALLARHEQGCIVPLAIAKSPSHMDSPLLATRLRQGRYLLKRAIGISEAMQVPAQPLIRIDDNIANGISRAAREIEADLIVMGWSPKSSLPVRLFGNVIDRVFWASHCPVAVVHLLVPPANCQRILVPIKVINPESVHTVRFAQLLAESNGATITILNVSDRHRSPEDAANFDHAIEHVMALWAHHEHMKVVTVCDPNIARGIVTVAATHDLVVLRSMRRRTSGGLAVSDVTTQVIREIDCSFVLFGEPHA
jgi:Kef-type K+ transport system membrane component KefB/nucleotide-binding universal stress UspA family protein